MATFHATPAATLSSQWLWNTAELSDPRLLLAATAAGSKVLLAGGFHASSPPFLLLPANVSAVIDIYDTETRSWSTATLSQARGNLAAAAVGNKAMFAGGFAPFTGSGATATVDIYDTETGAWSVAMIRLADSPCG